MLEVFELYEMIVVMTFVLLVLLISIGLPLRYSSRKKRLEEEHRTSNLALAYQILSTRKEISFDEVKQLIVLSGNNQPLPQGYLPDQNMQDR